MVDLAPKHRCVTCGRGEPHVTFYTRSDTKQPRSECADCCRARGRALDAERRAAKRVSCVATRQELRECPACHGMHPLEEYKRSYAGHVHGSCRKCRRQQDALREAEKRRQLANDPVVAMPVAERITYVRAEGLRHMAQRGPHRRAAVAWDDLSPKAACAIIRDVWGTPRRLEILGFTGGDDGDADDDGE